MHTVNTCWWHELIWGDKVYMQFNCTVDFSLFSVCLLSFSVSSFFLSPRFLCLLILWPCDVDRRFKSKNWQVSVSPSYIPLLFASHTFHFFLFLFAEVCIFVCLFVRVLIFLWSYVYQKVIYGAFIVLWVWMSVADICSRHWDMLKKRKKNKKKKRE